MTRSTTGDELGQASGKALDRLRQSTLRSGIALPIAIAVMAIVVRAIAWYVFRDLPASTDWINHYNPAAVAIANGARLDFNNYALNSSPVYALFLAVLYRIFSNGVTTMRGVQILLDGLVVLGIFALGDRVFNRRLSVLAGLAYALYPPSIYMVGVGQPEMLLTLCLMGLVLVWLWASGCNSSHAYLLVGILLGIALLIKPNYLGLLPFWFVIDMLLLRHGRRQALANIAAACIGVLAVNIPWYVFRSLSYNSTASGNVYANIVYMGSILRPTLSGGSLMPLREFYSKGFEVVQKQLGTNSPTTGMVLQLGFRNWLALIWPNPLNMLEFLANKFWQVWYATDSAVYDKFVRWFQIPVIILWFGGFISVLSNPSKRARQRPLLLISGYTILALIFITPLFREFLPVMPIILLFAAYGALCLTVFVYRRLFSNPVAETSL